MWGVFTPGGVWAVFDVLFVKVEVCSSLLVLILLVVVDVFLVAVWTPVSFWVIFSKWPPHRGVLSVHSFSQDYEV